MTSKRLAIRNKRVIDSVFGSTKFSQPTPFTTPIADFSAPREPFGGHHSSQQIPSSFSETSHVQDQVRWDRAWHTVTDFLLLPPLPAEIDALEVLDTESDATASRIVEALKDVLDPQQRVPRAGHTEDLIDWHIRQSRHHFLHEVFPLLRQILDQQSPEAVLIGCLRLLHSAQGRYVHGLSVIAEQEEKLRPGAAPRILRRFKRNLNAVVGNSIADRLSPALRDVLERYVSQILGLPEKGREQEKGVAPAHANTDNICRQMLSFVESLHKVGLAGEAFEVIFADIMNDAMTRYVYCRFHGTWAPNDNSSPGGIGVGESRESFLPRMVHHASPSRSAVELCEWIEERYSKLIVLVFKVLDMVEVLWSDKEKWKEMSVGRLAALRTTELFDIVCQWPNSGGALHDLRTAITTPQRRLHLTELFVKALHDRLLHPGMSTLQILRTYISMIWSFHSLDHSKVLLDRVAWPLQIYLGSREDTVRIIITGLLSDVDDGLGGSIQPQGDKLTELALILHHGTEQFTKKTTDEELDWHDLDWLPDPVDAGPGYRRSKNADVIGTLFGVLGSVSKDVFIKEFQTVLGEHLLKQDGAFEKEIRVLELLKRRFGEAPLQNCEVMLKDIHDSSRLDRIILKTQTPPPKPAYPEMHAKILSRLFWPAIQDEEYKIPSAISDLHNHYASRFYAVKSSRVLKWLHALGFVTVELELQDRTIIEQVHTWQATIIHAFHSESNSKPVQRTFSELKSHFEMSETLLRSALNFWVSKLVLREVQMDTFTVMETLNASDLSRSSAQAAAAAAAANDDCEQSGALGGANELAGEKMQMYWQFIQGMLTNSSKEMGLAQIGMMLKMLIAEGFPYGDEELQEFLAGKVMEGELEVNGGKYRLKK